MKSKIEKFFQQPWLSDYRTLAVLWGLLTLFCIYKIVHGGHPDYDYLIFTHIFILGIIYPICLSCIIVVNLYAIPIIQLVKSDINRYL